jgi:hypothetical protein
VLQYRSSEVASGAVKLAPNSECGVPTERDVGVLQEVGREGSTIEYYLMKGFRIFAMSSACCVRVSLRCGGILGCKEVELRNYPSRVPTESAYIHEGKISLPNQLT